MSNNKSKSIIWSAVERFSVQGIQFVLTLVIARFVTPSDYGLIAMLSIFMAIAQTFIDSGFGAALIQKTDRTEVDFSTVFYFNIIISFILYLLLFYAAPYIASFYHEPQLALITKIVGVNLILISFTLIPTTKLNIQLDFKSVSKATLISTFVSGGVGIVMAIMGYGVYALVIQTLLSSFLNAISLWLLTRWTPMFVFSTNSIKQLFGFGSKLLLSQLLHTIYLNLYSLVIGRVYKSTDVGLYNRANTFANFGTINITTIISRVYYPLLCESQDNVEEFKKLFYEFLRLATFIAVPICFGLAAVAEPFVLVALTGKWEGVVWPMKILLWAFSIYPWLSINNQPLRAKGRSDYFLYAEVIKKIVAVVILLISLKFGLIILCLSILVYNVSDLIIIVYYTKKVMKTSLLYQARELMPIYFSGVIMEFMVEVNNTIIPHWYVLQLIIGVPLGGTVYCLAAKYLKIPEFDICIKRLSKLL